MSSTFTVIENSPRILIEAELAPVAGTRIQPTGFPDLGPAEYEDASGTRMLLVESSQSMANRLEAVCWDESANSLASELNGLPYVNVDLDTLGATNSLLEFHRLNSPYIMNGVDASNSPFIDTLRKELELSVKKGSAGTDDSDDIAGVVNLRKLAKVCFKFDPGSLVHGVFLEKIAGRLRHPRAVSSFIEASGVSRADSGGVKFDRALPKPSVAGVDAKGGYGNVPFHRTEYTAKTIKVFFSIDLAQIRGYGLPAEAAQLLIVLSLWKIRRFLNSNMRLRSACELELKDGEASIVVKRPLKGFALPTDDELSKSLRELIDKCESHFAKPVITELKWTREKKKK